MEEKLYDESVKIDASTVARKIHPGKEIDDDESKPYLGSRNNERYSLKRYSCSCSYVMNFFQSHEVFL